MYVQKFMHPFALIILGVQRMLDEIDSQTRLTNNNSNINNSNSNNKNKTSSKKIVITVGAEITLEAFRLHMDTDVPVRSSFRTNLFYSVFLKCLLNYFLNVTNK